MLHFYWLRKKPLSGAGWAEKLTKLTKMAQVTKTAKTAKPAKTAKAAKAAQAAKTAAAAALLLAALVLPWWGGQLTDRLTAVPTAAAEATRQLPIYAVERDDGRLALSFDASWGAEYTPALLDILDEYQVKATFFLTDIWLAAYPEQAAEIARRGQEIGLHSHSHPDFTTLSEEQMRSELRQNADLTSQTTGVQATLFRPPFGAYDDRVITTVRGEGLTPVQWSVDSLDWQDLSAEAIVQRVTEKLAPGDIVLMHNNGLHTAEALPRILDFIRDQGWQPVPVGELLLSGETYIDPNGVQHLR